MPDWPGRAWVNARPRNPGRQRASPDVPIPGGRSGRDGKTGARGQAMGVDGFAERAGREPRAIGETARRRTVEAPAELTAQEAQVARMARDGLSNPEIATRLFVSPRTIQYHLRDVLTKLGIRSRSQLEIVLPSDPEPVPPRPAPLGPGASTTGRSGKKIFLPNGPWFRTTGSLAASRAGKRPGRPAARSS